MNHPEFTYEQLRKLWFLLRAIDKDLAEPGELIITKAVEPDDLGPLPFSLETEFF